MQTQQIKNTIQTSMLKDRFSLMRRWRQLSKHNSDVNQAETDNAAWQKLSEQAEQSARTAALRRQDLPCPHFDDTLPVSQRREEIAEAIRNNQVVIVAGETGSGKTTQLPKICLSLGRGVSGFIGHTQPRRLAARSVAERIADELGGRIGEEVGYKVRFNDQLKSSSYVKLMTDGILLAEIQSDRYLEAYDTLIIDEAHERSLNIDFLLGCIKQILPKRPDLKVIITSATIDHLRFGQHFNDAPVIEVSGRTYPVETHYRPLSESTEDEGISIPQAVLAAVEETVALDRENKRSQPGGILVFCSGEQEIRELAIYLRKWGPAHTEVLPLYARLSNKEQQKIFKPGRGRRIIISTNVAETSLTVPNIHYVIDIGTARISRYSYRSKVQRLPIEAISQASANQRQGRCGRIAAGLCIRLYSEEDFLGRPEFTDPEIQRTNLAAVILQMESLRLGRIEDFPFLDKPDNRFVKDGLRLLQELGAMNAQQRLTPLGRSLAKLPVDPRIGRMILAAQSTDSLREVMIIASALSVQDPRDRPYDHRQAADQAHKKFQDDKSDFLSLVNIWDAFEAQRQALTQNKLRQYCRDNFLNYMRMREWRDTHHQIKLVCKQLNFTENKNPAEYAAVHKAILSGLLSKIGSKDKEGTYQGARSTCFTLFPGSPLAKKKPQWVMAGEIVETSKLFARQVAIIEPEWVEPLAGDLVRHSYSDPVWRKRRGEVMARQKSILYGLVLQADRFVSYAETDPELCRVMFIDEALVAGEINSRAEFLQLNKALLNEVELLESKSRRRDIMVDDQVLHDFYNERIPDSICTVAEFEKWRKTSLEKNEESLLLTKELILKRDASEVSEAQYPTMLSWQGLSFPLRYSFEPGSEDDGVTLITPVGLLNQIPVKRLEWLVPGMLREKCIALLKALPKKWRRNFVPIPDYVDQCLPSMDVGDYPLSQRLGESLRKKSGIQIPEEEWLSIKLERQYYFDIEVLGADNNVLEHGRDLVTLRQRLVGLSEQTVIQQENHRIETEGSTSWDFSDLPEYIESEQAGIQIRRYPAIIDQGDSVALQLIDSSREASRLSRLGVKRLLMFKLKLPIRQLRKSIPGIKALALQYRSIGSEKDLLDAIVDAVVMRCFQLSEQSVSTAAEFECLYEAHRAEFFECADRILEQLSLVLSRYHEINKQLQGSISLTWAVSLADIKVQLNQLVYKGFLSDTSEQNLKDYPRYLNAILKRLEKLGGGLQKDRVFTEQLSLLYKNYQQRYDKHRRESVLDPELENYRWMLEEYRVSLFAQELKTAFPISEKRLKKQWTQVMS